MLRVFQAGRFAHTRSVRACVRPCSNITPSVSNAPSNSLSFAVQSFSNEVFIRRQQSGFKAQYSRALFSTSKDSHSNTVNSSLDSEKSNSRDGADRTLSSIISSLLRWMLLGGVAILGISLAAFPDWRKKVRNRLESYGRFGRCCIAIAEISAYYKYPAFFVGSDCKDDWSPIHQKASQRLLKLLQANGGIFIKAGQHICAMSYLLPIEYVRTMYVLLDKAPTRPYSDIEKVFVEEFGKKPSEVFEQFDEKPIASGSLAQVHRAVLKGEHVAVKIQYPGLREQCDSDVRTIELLTKVVALVFPDFKLKWLVDEFDAAAPKELNFVQEGLNALRLSINFKSSSYLHVPQAVWKLTSPRVLTMEWIDGVNVTDLNALNRMGISPKGVAAALTDVFSEQIFLHGFVHADPHPGNIFVRKTSGRKGFQLVLLDNGLFRDYNDDFRLTYARLWLSLLRGDEQQIRKLCEQLGIGNQYQLFAAMLTNRSYESIASNKMNSTATPEEMTRLKESAKEFTNEITQVLQTIPAEFLLLLKVNDMLRYIIRELKTDLKVIPVQMRYCMRAIQEHERLQRSGLSASLRAWYDSMTFNLKLAVMWIYERMGKIQLI
eukprot:TRINITY_DN5697_c0_g1_i1.p1 TRINITY_DN5697_c0_g1~~TRINITY_DN5697_c0_g1_i1.p1  ORF type:complete len:604 (+),score=58.17 TRINITY_DN5697_c0_g1_i1:76-1887(+)